MPARRPQSSVDVLRRMLAAGSAALVFALAVFAASPVLHTWLHDQGGVAGDDTCAVVLFGAGVSLPLGGIAATAPVIAPAAPPAAAAADLFLTLPRYLRQPERGPPVR